GPGLRAGRRGRGAALPRPGRGTDDRVPDLGRVGVAGRPLARDRLSLNQATVKHLDLAQSVDLCVRHEIPAIGLWRDRVAEAGLRRAVATVQGAGLHLS